MMDALARAPRGSVLVLHGCCHNPTGMDLADAEWDRLIDLSQSRELLPVVDLAYQGFGAGIATDRAVVEKLASRGFEFLVAQSMSKSFALYGERVGSLTAVLASPAQASAAAARLRQIVRSTYSNPPAHGAALVAHILATPPLRDDWENELGAMRSRIASMRRHLVRQLEGHVPGIDMSHVLRQRGLFSFTGLAEAEVACLRDLHAVHLLSTGRLCVAALNSGNVDRAAQALAEVLAARSSAG